MIGTSVEQIDRTYGHLLPDSIDRARTALETFGHLAGTEADVPVELSDEENLAVAGLSVLIRAPRFELGTSSPPGLSSRVAGFGGPWREVVI